eukprot:CAMPEP_0177642660 /NCGR_PEP_ID=MMETSP0447-20121125/7714_1 /TAXON_ID=0 /ORGANISM="Stygamoeba regulata, Strain BSH-02190019" /LENGTH=85 /DNA_ID=CAMNT_0019144851 /DNA_START=59 /DNA_END=316 /DNA_ORIENTATION=-
MENDEGRKVDLYIPRKCNASNRLITAKDHAAVQIPLVHLNSKGVATGEQSQYAICGYLRVKGDADAAFTRIAEQAGFIKNTLNAH